MTEKETDLSNGSDPAVQVNSKLNLEPGPILDRRSRASLLKAYRAMLKLFRMPGAEFSGYEWKKVKDCQNRTPLRDVVRWYWFDHNYDYRTNESDLKRELKSIVSHLDVVLAAMEGAHLETKRIVNKLISPPTWSRPEIPDSWLQIEQLNAQFLRICKPIVEDEYEKEASRRFLKACKSLMELWEMISEREFEHSYGVSAARSSRQLTTDLSEFKNDGMHFVHVLLQAIDSKVTYSKVRTNVRRVVAEASEDAIEQKLES